MPRQLSILALGTSLQLAFPSAFGQTTPQPHANAEGAAAHAVHAPPQRFMLPLTAKELRQFNDDFRLPHEAPPAGVPASYDWYTKPKRDRWNSAPAKFTALTGWGQAFWAQGTTTADAHLLLKNHMTLLCLGDMQWVLVQSAAPDGANFRADFAGNLATRAQSPGPLEVDATAVDVVPGRAYHFWPKGPRAALPKEPLCGLLVLVQARAEPVSDSRNAAPKLLLGLGADYWIDKTAAWDNYKTNSGIAVGRLRLVGTKWAWYGLSTASDEALERLIGDGFVRPPVQ